MHSQRDIRDPQIIGEMLLNRAKDLTILQGVDMLSAYCIPFYDESEEDYDKRWDESKALTVKPAA